MYGFRTIGKVFPEVPKNDQWYGNRIFLTVRGYYDYNGPEVSAQGSESNFYFFFGGTYETFEGRNGKISVCLVRNNFDMFRKVGFWSSYARK